MKKIMFICIILLSFVLFACEKTNEEPVSYSENSQGENNQTGELDPQGENDPTGELDPSGENDPKGENGPTSEPDPHGDNDPIIDPEPEDMLINGLYACNNLSSKITNDSIIIYRTTDHLESRHFFFDDNKIIGLKENYESGVKLENVSIEISEGQKEHIPSDITFLEEVKKCYLYNDYSFIIFSYNEKYYLGYYGKYNMGYVISFPEPPYFEFIVDMGDNDGNFVLNGLYELVEEEYIKVQVDEGLDLLSNDRKYVYDFSKNELIVPKSVIQNDQILVLVKSKAVYCTIDLNGESEIIDTYDKIYDNLIMKIDILADAKYSFKQKENPYEPKNLRYLYVCNVNDDLTYEEELEIAYAYYNSYPDNTDHEDNPFLIIAYFGRYNGGYAIYVTTNYLRYLDEEVNEEIGSYTFVYPNNNTLMFYKDSTFTTLKDAYTSGLLTDGEVGAIALADGAHYVPTNPDNAGGEMVFYKPIIYLYPEEDIDLVIKFKDPERLMTTYPKYNDGWRVHVSKNSTITIDDKSYYALFFDEKANIDVKFDEGFYVTKDNAIEFLEDSLEKLGFNYKEANEFIMYWLPILEQNEQSLVYFEQTQERNVECPLEMSIIPDTFLRVIIHIKKVDGYIDITPQELETVDRNGFTLVEWGGCIH